MNSVFGDFYMDNPVKCYVNVPLRVNFVPENASVKLLNNQIVWIPKFTVIAMSIWINCMVFRWYQKLENKPGMMGIRKNEMIIINYHNTDKQLKQHIQAFPKFHILNDFHG